MTASTDGVVNEGTDPPVTEPVDQGDVSGKDSVPAGDTGVPDVPATDDLSAAAANPDTYQP
jgi:hypothetical protein